MHKFCLKFDSSTECPQISLYDSKSLYKWIYGILYSDSRANETKFMMLCMSDILGDFLLLKHLANGLFPLK